MKSMTGFGRAAADCPEFSLTVDVSSVNKKGLELSVGLPREWQPMERLVAAKVREFYTRGKVGVSVKAAGSQWRKHLENAWGVVRTSLFSRISVRHK